MFLSPLLFIFICYFVYLVTVKSLAKIGQILKSTKDTCNFKVNMFLEHTYVKSRLQSKYFS